MEIEQKELVSSALAEVQMHRRKWSAIFGAKTAIWFVWIISCFYGLAGADDPFFTFVLQILLGAAFAHGVELQHQALHQSGFKSRQMSRFFGVLFGLPMLVSFSAYQDSHLFHHKKLGTPDDAEFFRYGNKSARRFIAIIKHFFLINHFCDFLKITIDSLNGIFPTTRLLPGNAKKIRFEYLFMASAFFGSAYVAHHFGSDVFVKFWIIPLFVFAAPIHALIELPEHFACDNGSEDVFLNTRTVKTNSFMTWFTNGNNYHVEHHWLASLPIEKLATIHKSIDTSIQNISPSYLSFYGSFFIDLIFARSIKRAETTVD
ncbi:MAG: Fatty acid desaturase [uncultured Paraburkholderia sp.]|nr:MAG: Fatty acid desaturase [uncultured Paraburkholderia sp.]CAH2810768.1 MAG: Fatty acid desaturase [uncultured Paraburkholderia sp.]CAH2945856.1 MAG: Fatty acid desaturase [uncultured Paraburkholderia sp.]CAH2946021.1 MAG: Fatty acid desaturase [uncultured Paraburkholderia sp.]